MKIQIDPHTLLRAKERGATEAETIQTLESGSNIEAKKDRLGRAMIFLLSR